MLYSIACHLHSSGLWEVWVPSLCDIIMILINWVCAVMYAILCDFYFDCRIVSFTTLAACSPVRVMHVATFRSQGAAQHARVGKCVWYRVFCWLTLLRLSYWWIQHVYVTTSTELPALHRTIQPRSSRKQRAMQPCHGHLHTSPAINWQHNSKQCSFIINTAFHT